MKVTKSQIKELIRHAIVELTEKTFGSQAQYDAYRKKHNLKPGSKHKVAGKTVTVRDTKKMSKKAKSLGDKMADKLNKRMADLEKKRKQGKSVFDVGGPAHPNVKKKRKVKESKQRRYTVKEVRMWMKKLEENRYKKVYNSDARRVAWMVNNEGRTLDEMPISMKKKWSKAQYGRERYLATEFLKSKSEQMNESVWSLPKGATTTSVDELDAELSRAGIKSNPDFTKLLVQVSGNKSKINKIMKTHKAKKIFEGLDLKKLETAIKDFQKKIKKQGRVTNARDEDHLKQLIKVYKQMGGKKIKEGKLTEDVYAIVDKFNQKKQDYDQVYFKDKDLNKVKKHLKKMGSKYGKMNLIKVKTNGKMSVVEEKLREQIREIIEEQLNEQKFKKVILPNDMKTKVKVSKMIKQLKLKIDKDYDVKALKARGGDQVISILPKHYNKFIELAMKNKLNPRG